ncbi:AEC family transporter [Scytonema millei]|uniref:AEC family transporter n=1 Tax=Scytonema millei VB511283 TaxID=1245923 RepID=A0A9X5E4R5_9CYAN|nr:AEC family transporter [Scytonema millei]NHC34159.1 AEC family transporter [Scytonema millei VB511283]
MTETLFHAYLPLIVWTSLGLIVLRLVPETLPHWLGRGLYWVGIPLEILALARQTNFSEPAGLAPGITLAAIGSGVAIAYLCLVGLQQFAARSTNANISGFLSQPWNKPSYQGSFILAAALGNTGFVGLSIVPTFIDPEYLSWIVFFSITHNIVGAYGFGVLIASYFGRSEQSHHWWIHLRDVLTVPILWAFAIGYFTQDVALPRIVESGLQGSIDVVISCAFLLIGMRLSQLPGWKSFQQGIVPAVVRVIVIPGLVGVATTFVLGLSGDRRLAMVLMSGVPTAFAGLIFAEEYELDRTTIASSIILSTILYLLVLPLWLYVFGN